jgi:hypothetical protein
VAREDTQFQPGQSGNPSGRPKRKPLTDAVMAELAKPAATSGPKASMTRYQAVAVRLLNIVLTGDRSESIAAAKLLWSYVEGQPTQPIELEIGRAAREISQRTGADPDWLVRRAKEIAAGAASGAADA